MNFANQVIADSSSSRHTTHITYALLLFAIAKTVIFLLVPSKLYLLLPSSLQLPLSCRCIFQRPRDKRQSTRSPYQKSKTRHPILILEPSYKPDENIIYLINILKGHLTTSIRGVDPNPISRITASGPTCIVSVGTEVEVVVESWSIWEDLPVSEHGRG